MSYLERVTTWASKYLADYPYWKIYKDKVGGNVRAEGPGSLVDTATSMSQLRQDLALLEMSPGKYVIHLKKEPDAKAGARETEFEVPYSYGGSTTQNNPAVGSMASNPAVIAGGGLMTVQQHEASIGKMAAEITAQVKKDMELEELRKFKEDAKDKLKELERIKKEQKEAKAKSFDPEAFAAKIGALTPLIDVIKAMMAPQNQVSVSGFDNVQQVPPAAQRKKPMPDPTQQETTVRTSQDTPDVQTETTVPAGDDATTEALNERLFQAEERFMAATGSDLEGMVIQMESLAAFAENNLAMYQTLKPTILNYHSQYKK